MLLDNAHFTFRVLTEEQRTRIRGRCFALLDEEDEIVGIHIFLRLADLSDRPLQISGCNEIIVSKIARHDFPTPWSVFCYYSTKRELLTSTRPSFFDDLMDVIDARLTARYSVGQENPQDALVLRRSLGILNAVIKEFASVKMLNGMKTMANVGFLVSNSPASRN